MTIEKLSYVVRANTQIRIKYMVNNEIQIIETNGKQLLLNSCDNFLNRKISLIEPQENVLYIEC
jgi:hypothetical protein